MTNRPGDRGFWTAAIVGIVAISAAVGSAVGVLLGIRRPPTNDLSAAAATSSKSPAWFVGVMLGLIAVAEIIRAITSFV